MEHHLPMHILQNVSCNDGQSKVLTVLHCTIPFLSKRYLAATRAKLLVKTPEDFQCTETDKHSHTPNWPDPPLPPQA